jgi:hypothetical protein
VETDNALRFGETASYERVCERFLWSGHLRADHALPALPAFAANPAHVGTSRFFERLAIFSCHRAGRLADRQSEVP